MVAEKRTPAWRNLLRRRIQANGFGAQREKRGAVRSWAGHRRAPHVAIPPSDFGAQEICLANELGGVGGGGMRINFAWRSDLFERAVAKQRDAVGEGHGFFLIVSDEEEGDAHFALQRFQFALHLFAQVGVERGERLVEEKQVAGD